MRLSDIMHLRTSFGEKGCWGGGNQGPIFRGVYDGIVYTVIFNARISADLGVVVLPIKSLFDIFKKNYRMGGV